MDKFILQIKNFMEENHMLENSDGVVLGLSGGPDSVCLLMVMCRLADYFGIKKDRIYCVHVNHMIRGAEADADEEFSRSLCADMGVSFVSYKKNIPEYAKELGCSLEEAGRKYRYEMFDKTMREQGLSRIAVAHNKNDVAETLIFNMLRGTGLNGMAGIKPVRGNIIRPLISTDRASIEGYLKEQGQQYRIDATNQGTEYDRNKIRHIIIPEMERINANALEHIYQLATQSQKAYEYICEGKEEKKKTVILNGGEAAFGEYGNGETVININALNECEDIVKEQLIHDAIAAAAGRRKDIGRRHILSVVELAKADTGKSVKLPYGLCARRSYGEIIISGQQETGGAFCIDIEKNGEYVIDGAGTFSVEISEWNDEKEVSKKIYTKTVDYGKIKGTVCIRNPKDGDYIIIDGKGSQKKLSRLFIDKKVDRTARLTWPVVACGSEIIWAVGLRYSEAYKVDENTEKIMTIIFEGKGE